MQLLERASNKVQASYGCKKVGVAHESPLLGHIHWTRFTVLSLNSCFADMSELNLTKGTSINFPEGKDKLMHFEIRIKPEDGTYKYVTICSAVRLVLPGDSGLHPNVLTGPAHFCLTSL